MTPKVEEYINYLKQYITMQNTDNLLYSQLVDKLDDLWYTLSEEEEEEFANSWIKNNRGVLDALDKGSGNK